MRPQSLPTFPRHLHPGAWWLWAIGLAAAASRTQNPVPLLLILVVAGLVVAARRGCMSAECSHSDTRGATRAKS